VECTRSAEASICHWVDASVPTFFIHSRARERAGLALIAPPSNPTELHIVIKLDFPAIRAAAREIVSTKPLQATAVAINVQTSNPVLSELIRSELERRAQRSAPGRSHK